MIETLHMDVAKTETDIGVSTKLYLVSDMETGAIVKSTKTPSSMRLGDTTITISRPVKHAPTM
jgi:hypothetical protein